MQPIAPLTTPSHPLPAPRVPLALEAVAFLAARLSKLLADAEPGRYELGQVQEALATAGLPGAPPPDTATLRRALRHAGFTMAIDGTGHLLVQPPEIREGQDATVLATARRLSATGVPVTIRALQRHNRRSWVSSWWLWGWTGRMVAGGLLVAHPGVRGPRLAAVSAWSAPPAEVASE